MELNAKFSQLNLVQKREDFAKDIRASKHSKIL